MNPDDIIAALKLPVHPLEGGYFRETYLSTNSTAIYYLLTPSTCSRMHRLPGDELFHFYLGDPVEQLHLRPDGSGEIIVLGSDLILGQRPQVLVPGGVWQGAALAPGGRLALLGTTMAPGFEMANYQNGDRDQLDAAYPEFADMIRRLTPETNAR